MSDVVPCECARPPNDEPIGGLGRTRPIRSRSGVISRFYTNFADRTAEPRRHLPKYLAGNIDTRRARSSRIGVLVNHKIDDYIKQSEQWPAEMAELRPILLSCGLTEEIKLGKPCFSHQGKNIVILQEMNEFFALMFLKGARLDDPAGVLEEQGPNSRSALRMGFTSVDDVARLTDTVTAYIAEAMAVEDAGLEVSPAPKIVFVAELQNRLDQDPKFKAAFEALTPGRQREYHLHFSDAKHAKTREARVEKYAPKILDGKGFRDP